MQKFAPNRFGQIEGRAQRDKSNGPQRACRLVDDRTYRQAPCRQVHRADADGIAQVDTAQEVIDNPSQLRIDRRIHRACVLWLNVAESDRTILPGQCPAIGRRLGQITIIDELCEHPPPCAPCKKHARQTAGRSTSGRLQKVP
jgi:hypothetical protein